MVDRADLNHLNRATNTAVEAARKDLAAFMAASASWPPDQVRDGLIEVMQALVTQYGDLAATAAAQWYEQMRAQQVQEPYRALLASPIPPQQVEGTVRYAAGGLYRGSRDMVLALLSGALHRYITGQARSTIGRNALHDKRAKKFARVTVGKTCAFCRIMASRGFVYTTAKAAGEFNKYHDDCDCMIVPGFADDPPHIEGYDPDALYADYQRARNAAIKDGVRNPDVAAIASKLRELRPELVSDGKSNKPKGRPRNVSKDGTLQATWVKGNHEDAKAKLATLKRFEPGRAYLIAPDRIIEAPAEWPNDLLPLRALEWYHILYGDSDTGGHLYGYGWRNGRTEFPPDWTEKDILDAAVTLLREHDLQTAVSGSVEGAVRGVVVRVAYRNDEKMRRIKTILALDPEW